MEAVYQDKLDQICERKGYAEIIDAVLGIPEEERDYQELAPYLRKYLIYGVMHGSFEAKDSVGEEEDCLIIPGWKVAVTPQIGQITHRSVVLDIYLYFPEWGGRCRRCIGYGPVPGISRWIRINWRRISCWSASLSGTISGRAARSWSIMCGRKGGRRSSWRI